MITTTLIITDPSGIHARPATILVNAASKFHSDIKLSFKEKDVNLKSIMGVMSLAIPEKAIVELSVRGEDEKEATRTLIETMRETGLGDRYEE